MQQQQQQHRLIREYFNPGWSAMKLCSVQKASDYCVYRNAIFYSFRWGFFFFLGKRCWRLNVFSSFPSDAVVNSGQTDWLCLPKWHKMQIRWHPHCGLFRDQLSSPKVLLLIFPQKSWWDLSPSLLKKKKTYHQPQLRGRWKKLRTGKTDK